MEDLSRIDALPDVLTPSAAEALMGKVYRMVRTENIDAAAAMVRCLASYQHPVAHEVLEMQMRIAVREASDLSFVPDSMQYLAEDARS
jgi:hypothetical protein